MRKLKIPCFILTIPLLLTLSLLVNAQSKRAPQYVVSFDSFGSVKVGMTVPKASKALGVRLARDAGYEGNSCYYVSPKGSFKNVAFMMAGQQIARIDIDGKQYSTDRGAKVGDTEAKIKLLYKGMYKVSKHPYVDGHYIEVKMKGGKYSLIFETDGKRVTSFRAGRFPEVGYIEGCS